VHASLSLSLSLSLLSLSRYECSRLTSLVEYFTQDPLCFLSDAYPFLLQDKTNNAFGEELISVCELFRNNSLWAQQSSGLPALLRMLLVDFSVQTVAPWNCLPTLLSVIPPEDRGDFRKVRERLTADKKQLLESFVGQPAIVKILEFAIGSDDNDTHPGFEEDVVVVISFLRYICDNVTLSLPADMRARILARATENPTPHPQLYPCPDRDPGATAAANHSCDHCQYDKGTFLTGGQHYPCWPVRREGLRGWYKKDGRRVDETSEQRCACDKDFLKDKAKGCTGKPGITHTLGHQTQPHTRASTTPVNLTIVSSFGYTGGMFVWACPHGVCAGFHLIPKAEGRNDVFTIMIERCLLCAILNSVLL
jgi:hypothetical protein